MDTDHRTTAYLGIDLGGSGAKAGVFEGTGRLLGFGQVNTSPATSPRGHTEIPIEEVYEAARNAARQAIAQSGAHIGALAFASQGQTFVSLDEHDRPLHPAILWYDSRGAQQAERMANRFREEYSDAPMPLIQAIAVAPKVLWLREHAPAVMARARRYLLLPDYLAYRLTGHAVTDDNTAMSTALRVPGQTGYSREALAIAGIEEEQLAEIRSAAMPIGRTAPGIAESWGLPDDCRVMVGTNDQYAGALGAGNCRPGIVSETSGTCLALVTLAESLPDPMPAGLIGGRFPIPGYQFALAYAKTAGVVLDWFRREWRPDTSLDELTALAADSPIGSNGITMLPHFDGMVSPAPNPHARGAFTGITLGHTTGDLYRAILEALSFSLRENIELLATQGFRIDCIRSIGGGAKSDFWLQMKADVTGLPVERPAVTEAATLGAAMLAAVGDGAYASIRHASETLYRAERTFVPDEARHEQYAAPFKRYRELCKRICPATG